MRKITIILISFSLLQQVQAQDIKQIQRRGIPVTISVFTESIGFPNFRIRDNLSNWGIRIGTEFYYNQSAKKQLLQNVQVGYYHHKGFHQGFFLNSAFGYRKYFGDFFADGTIGFGYMLVDSKLPRFERFGDAITEKKGVFGRFIPNIGLGTGYRFPMFSVFSRYEMFGEVPFGLNGVPALPHSAFHLGTRFSL